MPAVGSHCIGLKDMSFITVSQYQNQINPTSSIQISLFLKLNDNREIPNRHNEEHAEIAYW